jgi:hypothetical protein
MAGTGTALGARERGRYGQGQRQRDDQWQQAYEGSRVQVGIGPIGVR